MEVVESKAKEADVEVEDMPYLKITIYLHLIIKDYVMS